MDTATLQAGLARYNEYMLLQEKSRATRRQYARSIAQFIGWLGGEEMQPEDSTAVGQGRPAGSGGAEQPQSAAEITKQTVIRYKEKLQAEYKPATVNIKLSALNSLFAFLGRVDLKVRQLKIQREAYCAQEKELTQDEYKRLVEAAKQKGNEKLALVLQTICGTGIRVSELQFVTVEAVEAGEANIALKGKNRKILLPGKLCKLLKRYIRHRKIATGPVFVTRTGRPLDRSNIWRMMKALCVSARVDPRKVFPHNLRHLFARKFYAIDHDIAKLADILGHSSINTTRIYIMTTSTEHRKQLNRMRLILG